MNTQIINEALPLFNKNGFKEVRLANLLHNSNISLEEFHARFNDVDHLVLEIFNQFCREIDEISDGIDQPQARLDSFFDCCNSSYSIQQKYSFIFQDFYYITLEIDGIKDRYYEMLRLRKAQLSHLFQFFVRTGIFNKEVITGQFENLINQILIISGFWPTHSRIIFGEFNIEYYSGLTFSLLVPYLSESGLEEYQHLFQNKN